MNLTPEEIRRQGTEELENLKTRVLAWRDSYFRLAPRGDRDYLFLCNEFAAEIEEYVYPYIHRMVVTEHIEPGQAAAILDFCYQQVRELEAYLMDTVEPSTS
jgi:hypothetical protein